MLVSGPLASYMNFLAQVETVRDHVYMKGRGLNLPNSKSEAANLAEMNWQILSGQKGHEVISEYSELLQLHPNSELLEPFGLSFGLAFDKIFPTMADSFRRLCLFARQWKFRALEIGTMSENVAQAKEFCEQMAHVPKCCTGPFVDNVLSWFNGGNGHEPKDIIDLMRDALLHISASSVAVEKLHASTQRNSSTSKFGRWAHIVQQNSYVLSTLLEHKRLKTAIEDDTLGSNKTRAGRLLRERVSKHTMGGGLSGKMTPRHDAERRTVQSVMRLVLVIIPF